MTDTNAASTLEDLVVRCARAPCEPDWAELVARTRPVVARVCGHIAQRWRWSDGEIVADLVQEVYARLLKSAALARFEPQGEGSALRFLKAVAAGAAHDYCRAAGSQKRDRNLTRHLDEVAEPGIAPDAQRSVLLAEIEAALAGMASGPGLDRDLLIFQLHYRLGMTAAAIASIPVLELGPKGVEAVLARTVKKVQQELARPNVRDAGAAKAL